MDSEQLNFNLDFSFISCEQSEKFHPNHFFNSLYWADYYHQMAMWNLPGLFGPYQLTDSHLNPNYLLFQHGKFISPTTLSSKSYVDAFDSSKMNDLCNFNPSDSSKDEENPSLESMPNSDEVNFKDNVNKSIAHAVPSNQSVVSEDPSNDCPQTKDVNDHDGGKKQMAYKREVSKMIKKRSSHKVNPIDRAKFMDKHHPAIDQIRIEKIIARELELAVSIARKHREKLRAKQEKERIRPTKEKDVVSKSESISTAVDRINEACNPDQTDFQKDKISNFGANHQSKQDQLFTKPEDIQHYWFNYILGRSRDPNFMLRPEPEVIRQSFDPQLTCNSCSDRCVCNNSGKPMFYNSLSSSPSTSKHSDESSDGTVRLNHSILAILGKQHQPTAKFI